MPFSHLSYDRVKAIRKSFYGHDRDYNDDLRTLLMADIEPEYVQRLRNFDSNFNQLAGDLNSLNSRPKLTNGQVPLELWLMKAIEVVFDGLTEAQIFQQALSELRAGPADPGEGISVIVEGLDALIDLIRHTPGTYSAIIYYRKTFETALWEIDVIENYKLLHDGLHKMQLNWPPTDVVNMMLENEAMRQMLLKYSATLNTVAAELRDTYENGYVDGVEKAWIDELKEDQNELEKSLNATITAGEANAEEQIKKCFSDVKEVLSTKLSQLNNRLKAAINTLHLADLIKAMNEVCSEVSKLSPDSTAEQIKQYKAGATELSNLDDLIEELIKGHDDWQKAVDLLGTLGETLKKGTTEGRARSSDQEQKRLGVLEFIKDMIDRSVSPLLVGKTTLWSNRLGLAAQRFDAEVERRETDKAEQTFEGYREQAWHYFFELDTQMKTRCEELKVVGTRLRKINEQLRFNEDLDL